MTSHRRGCPFLRQLSEYGFREIGVWLVGNAESRRIAGIPDRRDREHPAEGTDGGDTSAMAGSS
jgi:hypothetical protein